ncbi:hypothetical protein TeGR_g14643, partial [Tetraparma gracilis]
PDGRIFQVEYAGKAVDNAGTALGVLCSDGIVLAVQRELSAKMLVAGSASQRRIHKVDDHVGVGFTGAPADGRQVVNRAAEECVSYRDTYGVPIPGHVLAERLSQYVHYFTLHGALRPFGSSVIVAAFDEDADDFGLYMVDPSGMHYKYYGCAAGKGRASAKTELEKVDNAGMTVKEGVKELAR